MSPIDDATGAERNEFTAPPASNGFLAILWQRKSLVLLASLLGVGGGALYYWQSAPVYQTGAQLWVIKKNAQMIGTASDPRMSYVEDYMATNLHVLRSPLVIERAISMKNLKDLKTFEGCADPAAIVGVIRTSFTAGRDTREASDAANILLLTFRGPVAEDCGKVLKAIVESFQENLDIGYRNASVDTINFITKARDLLKIDLAACEDKYFKFQQKHSLTLQTKNGNNVQLEHFLNVDAEHTFQVLHQIKIRERIKFLEEALAKGKEPQVLLDIINKTTDQKQEKLMLAQLLPLLIKDGDLGAKFAADHPEVASVRRSIDLVRQHYGISATGESPKDGKSPLERHLTMLREESLELDGVIKSQDDLLVTLKTKAEAVKNREIEENHLHQDVQRTNLLYEATIKRLTEISLVKESGGMDAKLLSNPGAGQKIAPTTRQTILLGLALGILAGVGLAYLADMTDKSFRSPDEVRRILALPLLGHVPFLKAEGNTSPGLPGEEGLDPLLCTLFRPRSLESEAFRAIRTSLFFSTQDEGHKVLQVSSPNKSDGKSLTASNLAISMAQSGKKVLMIDADCRRPRQHKNFNLPNTAGLVTVIAEGVPWKDMVHATGVEGLSVMPSGPIPPNAAEMLSSRRFPELLEAVRAEYDYVIVDTPPLLAVTDPCVVAGLVDGLVLVLRLSRQSRPHAERARAILLSLGVNIFGVVVNGIVRQGAAGIYSSEHYDYTESYEDPSSTPNDDYYYYQEDKEKESIAVPPAKKDAPSGV